MYKFSLTISIIFSLSFNLIAQPDLEIEPRQVTFEDIFSRLDYTYIYNDGDQVLYIDSLSATKPHYILDFENHPQLPIVINPGDTIRLNITLTNFYNITVNDTADTVWVYSNDSEGPRDIRIKIDFFDDNFGTCSGIISDEALTPLPNSKIFFFSFNSSNIFDLS